jgi:hypothetical protein
MPPIPFKSKFQEVVAIDFVSNCSPHNKRHEITGELHEYLPMYSYGICHHNRELHQDAPNWPVNDFDRGNIDVSSYVLALRKLIFSSQWQERKFSVLMRAKFVLAMENAMLTDYVTEKASFVKAQITLD